VLFHQNSSTSSFRHALVAFAAAFPAIGALIAAWLALVSALPHPFEARWIAGIYERKMDAADALPAAPRYLLFGGSSVHFSYSAEVIADLTGLPVINMGTHAGLGADYLLYKARQVLRPGDTAIIALEHHLLNSTGTTSLLAPYVLTSDLRYLLHSPPAELPRLLFGYPPVEVVRQVAAASQPWTSPLYQVNAVTEFGDESANTPLNKLPTMLAGLAGKKVATFRARSGAPAGVLG